MLETSYDVRDLISVRKKSRSEKPETVIAPFRVGAITLLLSLSLLLGCKFEPKASNPTTTTKIKVPKFDGALAYAHVERQLAFGTRVPGSPTHSATRDWIAKTMQSYGWEVELEHFTAKVYTGAELPGTNIIAKYNPEAVTRILLAAHYDTRHIAEKDETKSRRNEPIMGADDGASGVAVLMSLAKTIGQSALKTGVDIVFFDVEDYGNPEPGDLESWAIGSAHWAKNVDRRYKPKHAILLDMVGAQNATFPKEANSTRVNKPLVDKVWKLAQDMGYGNYFVNEESEISMDDHISVYKHAQIPMIDIINMNRTGLGHYHHTHKDDIEIIDKRTMKAAGQVMMALVFYTQNGKF